MDAERLLMPAEGQPLGRSRSHVLDMLHAADRPVGVREVAQWTGMHPNTARFHRKALVEAGLAAREAEDRETPGRPRIGYRAVADGPGGNRQYRLLAAMLVMRERVREEQVTDKISPLTEEGTMGSEHPVLSALTAEPPPEEGGDPVCWAHLVCLECGAVIREGHRAGCQCAQDGPVLP